MGYYSSAMTTDGVRIAYLQYTGNRKKLIVIAPGFFNSMNAVLLQKLKDALLDTYDVVMFDFRGHGKSSGLYSWTSHEHLDLETVLAKVRHGYSKVGLIGFAFGAASSMRFIVEQGGVDALVAISAPISAAAVNYHFWQLDFENDILYNLKEGRIGKGVRPGPFWLSKKNPIDLIGRVTCPVYFIHGEKDWVTGSYQSQLLFDKATCPKKLSIIKNGLHAEYLLRKNFDETIWLMKEWLAQNL